MFPIISKTVLETSNRSVGINVLKLQKYMQLKPSNKMVIHFHQVRQYSRKVPPKVGGVKWLKPQKQAESLSAFIRLPLGKQALLHSNARINDYLVRPLAIVMQLYHHKILEQLQEDKILPDQLIASDVGARYQVSSLQKYTGKGYHQAHVGIDFKVNSLGLDEIVGYKSSFLRASVSTIFSSTNSVKPIVNHVDSALEHLYLKRAYRETLNRILNDLPKLPEECFKKAGMAKYLGSVWQEYKLGLEPYIEKAIHVVIEAEEDIKKGRQPKLPTGYGLMKLKDVGRLLGRAGGAGRVAHRSDEPIHRATGHADAQHGRRDLRGRHRRHQALVAQDRGDRRQAERRQQQQRRIAVGGGWLRKRRVPGWARHPGPGLRPPPVRRRPKRRRVREAWRLRHGPPGR